MSSMRSAVEEMRARDVAALPNAALEEDFAELQLVSEQLEAERLRLLGEINRRRTFERDGFLSTAAWLVAMFRMAWSEAGRQVRMARELERMPRTREALAAGDISVSAAWVLVSARHSNPEEFER